MSVPTSPRPPSLAKAGPLAALLGCASLTLARALGSLLAGWGPAAGVDDVVATGSVALGLLASTILAAGTLLLAASAAARSVGRTSRRLDAAARSLTPTLVRRAVAVTVGTGLGLAASTGAATATDVDVAWAVTDARPAATQDARPTAAPDGADQGAATGPTLTTSADAGWVITGTAVAAGGADVAPSSPAPAPTPVGQAAAADAGDAADAGAQGGSTGAAPVAPPGPPAAEQVARTATDAPAPPGAAPVVVVRPGDTLWAIAERHLPAGADAADVAAAWPAWFAANAAVVGADPDLIHPGQRLTVPDAVATATGDPATQEQP